MFGAILQPMSKNDRAIARLSGIREMLAEHGLGLRPQHLCVGPATIQFGRESLRSIFERPEPQPTAIICGNDTLAVGAFLESRKLGLRVPDDLSITGFDDIEIAGELDPPLTTMKVDNVEIGRLAALQLISRMRGESPSLKIPIQPIFLERGTTSRPR